MAWHDATCEGLDLEWDDERPGCRRCKLWAPHLLPAQALPPPPPPPDTKRKDLICNWPPCIVSAYSPFLTFGSSESGPRRSKRDRGHNARIMPLVQNVIKSLESKCSARDLQTEASNLAIAPQARLGSSSDRTIYRDLQDVDAIRLLVLHGSVSQHEPIYFTLETWRLRDPCIPVFEAFSYTWSDANGDNSLCQNIFTGTHYDALLVTRNCEAALRSFRTRCDRLLWVDAICINQNNQEERAIQVALMPHIYSTAARVLMYLGDSDPETDEVMDALVASNFETDQDLDLTSIKLQKILDRKYFTRTWMIQEVQLANLASLRIGNRTIQWEFFRNLVTDPKFLQTIHRRKTWVEHEELSRGSTQKSSHSLLTYLHGIRHCQSGDPRDQVYALLGLAESEAGDLPADYGISVQQLYTGLAMYWLSRGDFKFLNALGIPKSIPHLPSWVTDWTAISAWPAPEIQVACETFHINMPVISRPVSELEWYAHEPNAYGWIMDDEFWSTLPRRNLGTHHSDSFLHPLTRTERAFTSNKADFHLLASRQLGYLILDAFRLPFNRKVGGCCMIVRDNWIYLQNITGTSQTDRNSNHVDVYDLHPYTCLHLRKALLLRRHANSIFSAETHFKIDCKPPEVSEASVPPLLRFNSGDLYRHLAVLDMRVVNQWLMDIFYFGTRLDSGGTKRRLSSRRQGWSRWFPQAARMCKRYHTYLYQHEASLQSCNVAQLEAMVALRHQILRIMSQDELGVLYDVVLRPRIPLPGTTVSWDLYNMFMRQNISSNAAKDPPIEDFDTYFAIHVKATCIAATRTGPKTIDEAISLWSQKVNQFEELRNKCGSMRATLDDLRNSWIHPCFEFRFRHDSRELHGVREAMFAFHALVRDLNQSDTTDSPASLLPATWGVSADKILSNAWLLLQDLEPSAELTAEQNCNILWIHVSTLDMVVQLGEILHYRRIVKALDYAVNDIERIVLI